MLLVGLALPGLALHGLAFHYKGKLLPRIVALLRRRSKGAKMDSRLCTEYAAIESVRKRSVALCCDGPLGMRRETRFSCHAALF